MTERATLISHTLSAEEVDLLLLQLIEQHRPACPSDAEALAVVRWAEGVRLSQQLLRMVLDGEAIVRIADDGVPKFTLTGVGLSSAKMLIDHSPEARATFDRLVAAALDRLQ